MSKPRAPFLLLFLWLPLMCAQADPPGPPGDRVKISAELMLLPFGKDTTIIIFSNNVVAIDGLTLLTANYATVNTNTGDIFAEGSVRIQKQNATWVGEHLHYNYFTTALDAQQFRAGQFPTFVMGEGLAGNRTNGTYTATNAVVTADDYYRPLFTIHAEHVTIVPTKYVEARNATLWVGNVPVFYFPYYHRDLENANDYSLLPGYRTSFGPFILGTYRWFWNDWLETLVHADYREKRGPGTGPDVMFHLGDYGEGVLKYYYTYDRDPSLDGSGLILPNNRQRALFTYQGTPMTNLAFSSQVAWWSDPLVTHDFFESEYRKDIQPQTFFEANKLWRNWSLDAITSPRVNDFFETVERLPEIRLTGFQQQIFDTPLFYQSESSVGWYDHVFSNTNTTQSAFSASRADTWHQITLPETFFGWLNVTPRAGGRFTAYSEAEGPGATTTAENRTVFNTGVEISTKASRTWPEVQSQLFDLNGLRHIIEPSIDYVYVPSPSVSPLKLPQFDYFLTNSLYMVPIDFPDFNSIDSIDSQNVIRWGLNNRLQTKREGQVQDVASLGVYVDWRLKPLSDETTFSDVFSYLELKPRKWLTLSSQVRYDIEDGKFNLARHVLTIQPSTTWSWSLGQYYLRGGTIFGPGENLATSTFYYRFNDNWGARISHIFDASAGVLQEQYYTIYRDLRSWTAGFTFRVENNLTAGKDYTFGVTFSLKAIPRFGLGQDTVSASTLVGY
jgi:LPS-assembly protein